MACGIAYNNRLTYSAQYHNKSNDDAYVKCTMQSFLDLDSFVDIPSQTCHCDTRIPWSDSSTPDRTNDNSCKKSAFLYVSVTL